MTSSSACHNLIKSFEGFRSIAYQDVVGVWTVGYGCTDGVEAGFTTTEEAASEWLEAECGRISNALSAAIHVPLNQMQFDACVCFSYNLGVGAFKGSTLLKRINAQDPHAADEFMRWNKAGNPPKVLAGLTRRRQAEKDLFLRP